MTSKSKKLKIIITAAVILIAGVFLLAYVRPMKDLSLNLSLMLEDGMGPEDYDSRGWQVYTQEGDVVTMLEPDGFGGFRGLELGQTFYCSRVMEEELDSPTLRIAPVDRSFSVWLDDVLLYTDCPELDNRIGRLTLPMFEWFREEAILISLPMDYRGKTLTIAQSFPDYSDTGTVKAHPTDVVLYCGYAYESGLISESFATAILEMVMFSVGCFMLYAFVSGSDWSMLCLALGAFLEMVRKMIGASFFWRYFGTLDNSPTVLLPLVSAGLLLMFLTLRGGFGRKILWGILAVYGCAICACAVMLVRFPYFDEKVGMAYGFADHLSVWMAFCGLVMVLVLGIWKWGREDHFYRVFVPLALCGIAVHWIAVMVLDGVDMVWSQLVIMLSSGQITYVYYKVVPAITVAAMIAAVMETLRLEVERRTEANLIESRLRMVQESYETMHHQHEEIMMMRHDMIRHFLTLRGISDQDRAMEYIDTIVGQNEGIVPVVGSKNEMLNIILNSRLAIARKDGIRIEVIRVEAPAVLPVRDADMCSLVMNAVDNAIEGARRAEAAEPVIRLDIHLKNGYFVFVCENSAADMGVIRTEKNQTVPKHGLGVKIIRKVAAAYQGMTDMEYEDGMFRIRIVIPLDQLDRY